VILGLMKEAVANPLGAAAVAGIIAGVSIARSGGDK
jgi:hypothetical protein